ncbi:hypothetical protein Poli38472_011407 [Pythium oligandrum]|uniref:ABC transporter domain-containing protein n=1 Tax=Pythium oligandrum TaxID=41045 RepID=A0A8K1CLJ7_PYTOL|nr:hypothetical protein Poli38472_011407 [Pythium oligandrum]|eukprot:TMW64527.1 hypothetical protein Poli38472_011407 [Pythium oligandrum]
METKFVTASPKATHYQDLEVALAKDSHLAGGLGINENPCTLSWSNLTYTVDVKRTAQNPDGRKTILENVSGRCAPGDLMAVMGPSGSGKTTLLDVLADRISSGSVDGTIELNGSHRQAKPFRAVTSYVAQEDSLLGSFTVVETLQMAAKLSLPRSVDNTMIAERVAAVIDEMGLRSCEHTLIGDIFRKGLSGGQKRRLSIAIELLSNPSILLLDEPTSGLDSSSTYNVMKFITNLCQEKKTVICTIHQPSSLVYEMFTTIMLLSGGKTVYCGPRRDAIAHFSNIGFECPMYANPAEYFIELVNDDFEGHGDINMMLMSYTASSAAVQVANSILADRGENPVNLLADLEPPSAWRQFWVLMWRNTLNNIRNPGIYWVRLFMYFMLSFMIGTMYLYTNDDISDEDYIPMFYYVQAFLVFMSVAVLPFFIEQRAVFNRERANSGLSVASYTLANFLAALPGIFIIALISTLFVVLLADLNGFSWFLLNLFLSLVVAESLMHVISAAVPHYIIGIALGAGIYGMFMLCEGFMVPRESIPDYWIWGYYLAFHTYSFESFVYEHFSRESSASAASIIVRLNLEDCDTPRNMGILTVYAIVLQVLFAGILYLFHTGRR